MKDNFNYGITEDRFNAFEHDLFHSDLQAKQKHYKHLGVAYQGQRAPHVAFSRRDKFSLQNSKVFEKGQKKYKTVQTEKAIFGRRKVNKDLQEEKSNGSYIIKDVPDNRKPEKIKTHKSVNFDKVLEYDVRERYHLMFGHGKNVNKYKATALKNYNKSISAGSISDAKGRYQGGFIRRHFIDKSTKSNNANPEYEFVLDNKTRLDIDKYYHDFGNSKTADALIDEFLQSDQKDQIGDRGKLIPSDI